MPGAEVREYESAHERTNEQDMERLLALLFAGSGMGETDAIDEAMATVVEVSTFAEVSMLTRDRGVVVRLVDGTEWALAITKTRGSR